MCNKPTAAAAAAVTDLLQLFLGKSHSGAARLVKLESIERQLTFRNPPSCVPIQRLPMMHQQQHLTGRWAVVVF